jgi:hypothetical protein
MLPFHHLSICMAVAALVANAVTMASAQPFKMTTPIAPGLATPDRLETSIGTMNLTDGVPTPDTIEKIYDNLERSRPCRPICWPSRSSTRPAWVMRCASSAP